MKLNRERVAAGLACLIMVFGLMRIFDSRMSAPPPAISTAIPPFTQEIPRIESRLYLEDTGGDRNPYQLATDWAAITPESLDPPLPEPSRWLVAPLGKSPDPAQVGYRYRNAPPEEPKGGSDEKDADKTDEKPARKPGEKPAEKETASSAPRGQEPEKSP